MTSSGLSHGGRSGLHKKGSPTLRVRFQLLCIVAAIVDMAEERSAVDSGCVGGRGGKPQNDEVGSRERALDGMDMCSLLSGRTAGLAVSISLFFLFPSSSNELVPSFDSTLRPEGGWKHQTTSF